MLDINRTVLTALCMAAIQLTSWQSHVIAGGDSGKHAHVKPVGNSGINEITLTQRAAERLDIQTAPVTNGVNNRKVISYASVLYDSKGNEWAYTNPKPLVFIRESIKIDYIDGDVAILHEGPKVGTKVVTVGVAELYGVEKGIGK